MSDPFLSGIVLAAGRSSRFGGKVPKQLIEFEGETLVHRMVRQALDSKLAEVVIVLRHQAQEIRAALADLDARLVEEPTRLDQCLSSSLRTGLGALSPRAVGVVIIPADQPLISTALIDRVIDAYRESGSSLVATSHQGHRGSPALFDRTHFAEIDKLQGNVGAKILFRRYPDSIVDVEIDDRWILADIDTRKDFDRMLRRHSWPERMLSAFRNLGGF